MSLTCPYDISMTSIFQEYKTQHHILIFRCSQITTKFVRAVPYTVFNRLLFYYFCFLCHFISSLLQEDCPPCVCFKDLGRIYNRWGMLKD